jgi:methylenetetrahydrofolate dehydrogenase (NADP+)/methenyltetrahydrofolate cyclohydrolase
MIIDGKALAASIRAKIADEVSSLNLVPGLAVVIVGDDAASNIYVRNKAKFAEQVGIDSSIHYLQHESSVEHVLETIWRLNADPTVHGILVQLPLRGMDAQKVIEAIDPKKDVDGFHPVNVGQMMIGLPGLRPCTPVGCIKLIKTVQEDLTGMNALVIGASNIVGKPMAQLLLAENCTVTQAHIHTKNLPAIARRADIIVVAAGVPGLVKPDWVQPGAIVIDVGINRVVDPMTFATKIVGDVDPAVQNVARAMTPVPGGVGPMTIACLLENTVKAAKNA